jgi:hypothetical protein
MVRVDPHLHPLAISRLSTEYTLRFTRIKLPESTVTSIRWQLS